MSGEKNINSTFSEAEGVPMVLLKSTAVFAA